MHWTQSQLGEQTIMQFHRQLVKFETNYNLKPDSNFIGLILQPDRVPYALSNRGQTGHHSARSVPARSQVERAKRVQIWHKHLGQIGQKWAKIYKSVPV